MVYVVAPESGTVAAPPLSEFWVKLPSGEVSWHEVTPLALQKTVVRAPSGTAAGTAQISALGSTYGPLEVAAVVVAAGFGVALGVMLPCCAVGACACTTGCPTLYPRSEQRLSKNVAGMMYERKLVAQGRLEHMPATVP